MVLISSHLSEPKSLPFTPTKIAVKIATREGFFHPGTLPFRYHNPGSLSYAGQHFAIQGPEGFAIFPNDLVGWNALMLDIQLKRRKHQRLNTVWTYLNTKD